MSASRKLLADIERCLKLVDEGIDRFDSTWEKVQSAPNQNLKDKYEAELKKEIKKLQRHRDQIKTWVSSSEVKSNRKRLLDARKSVERQMERFKALEKESKTKRYSKEGLARQNREKKESDPRDAVYEWIDEFMDQLKEQLDEFDEEFEKLSQQSRRKRGNTDEIEEVNHWIERHRWHLEQLKGVKARLAKNVVSIRQVERIKEDLEYYISDNQDPDFVEDEELYETIEEPDSGAENEDDAQSESEPEQEPVPAKPAPTKTTSRAKQPASPAPTKSGKEAQRSATSKSPAVKKTKAGRKADEKKAKKAETPKPAPVASQWSQDSTRGRTIASTIRSQEVRRAAESQQRKADAKRTAARLEQQRRDMAVAQRQQQQPLRRETNPQAQGTLPQPQPQARPAAAGVENPAPARAAVQNDPRRMQQPHQTLLQQPQQRTGAAGYPGIPSPQRAAMPASYMGGLRMLDESHRCMPNAIDTERARNYTPRNPFHTPQCFWSEPPSKDPAIFSKFHIDTLFFIFYFQQGTQHQYLAARELRKQSWRYHKLNFKWFKRHAGPKVTTHEFEEGAYMYFDYENGWQKMIEENFRFEYKYLEDELKT